MGFKVLYDVLGLGSSLGTVFAHRLRWQRNCQAPEIRGQFRWPLPERSPEQADRRAVAPPPESSGSAWSCTSNWAIARELEALTILKSGQSRINALNMTASA